MPRLSRDDAWRVVEALQHLEVLDPDAAARLEVGRVLGRLTQRAEQANARAMPGAPSNPTDRRSTHAHHAIRESTVRAGCRGGR